MRESEMSSCSDILRFGAKAGRALFFILNFALGAPLSKAESDRLPEAVERAARAIVKINTGADMYVAGFAVKAPDGENFIAADLSFAVAGLREASKFQIEDIYGRRILGEVYVAAFDMASRLALLKAPGWSGPVLPLSDFKAGPSKEAHYQLSFISEEQSEEKGGWEEGEWKTAESLFPGKSQGQSQGKSTGKLRYAEVFGLAADWKHSFYGYTHGINRRAGPLLNKNGALAGSIYGHDRRHAVFGAKSSALEKLLKSAARRRFSAASFVKEMEKQLADMGSAAMAGDGEAAWTLALFSRDEAGDRGEYEKWRDLALRAGNSRAFYFAALEWIELEEYEKALPALRGAADQGQSSAMPLLASAFLYGEAGVVRDLKAGALLMQKAAERQNPEAAWELAALYLFGEGLPKDTAKGMEILHDLERKGFKPAGEALKRMAMRGPLFSYPDKSFRCRISIMGK